MGWGLAMQYRFQAEEWQGLSGTERVARCRLMALEANKLARDAEREETKRLYMKLAREWEALARDMETDGASNGSSAGNGSARPDGLSG
jgi:hypothetical protein